MGSLREGTLNGVTYRVSIDGETTVYVTLNFQDNKPFEAFIRIDDPAINEWAVAVTLLITRSLRAGEPLKNIAAELIDIHSPRTLHFYNGERVPSLLARIGSTLLKAESDYTRAKTND